MPLKDDAASLLERSRRMPPRRLDAVLASLFVVTGLATSGNPEPGYEPRDGLALVLILAATLPYFVRRMAPTPVFVVAMTATATLYVLDHDAGGLPFLVAAGAYAVAAYRPLREVVPADVERRVSRLPPVQKYRGVGGLPQGPRSCRQSPL